MSEAQTPPPPSQPAAPPAPPPPAAKDGEIPLEDIDRLLADVDPEFTKSLEEVRSVESDKDIVIDSAAIDDEEMAPEAVTEDKTQSRLERWRLKLKLSLLAFRLALKQKLILLAANTWIFLKTRPREFFLFSLVMGKVLGKKAATPFTAFYHADRLQKLVALILVGMVGVSLWTLLANFQGIWLPRLMEPMLTSFEDVAESVETYQPSESESFYAAFPQELHEYLFPKMKVNLKRTGEHTNPMGAFEVIVSVDSKDTAIEVSDRKIEFFDMLQRIFEDEKFNDLELEPGKKALKARIKRELNQKLTQGWVKEVRFGTFVLKP